MTYDPDIHHRRSIRLKGFDYSSNNAYFVTVCVEKRRCLLGEIVNTEMVLNENGKVVVECWTDLPNHYSNIQLDKYVVMPNHFHGIIQICGVELKADSVLPERAGYKPAPTNTHGLSEIVRGFKTFSARRINTMLRISGKAFYQRNYYEHVIRNDYDLNRIRDYILTNPANWQSDELYNSEGKSGKYFLSLNLSRELTEKG
jgi:REP element-mobilizing transposase RayT